MKTISKYQLREIKDISQLLKATELFIQSIYKIAIFFLVSALAVNAAYGQRGISHKTKDSALYIFAGASKLFVQRQAFDQWTRGNFNLTEPYRPNVYVDLGMLYYVTDFGAELNLGSGFQTAGVYAGRRLTAAGSPIGSWLNLEMGDFFGRFTNITPPTYNTVPARQQLTLYYDSFYISLVSKNYLNFLQYNARLGRARIPVTVGFFVSAGWQPGKRDWSYGYYDKDSVFHAQRLKPIPRLGKIQATAGVFAGF